MLRLLRRTRSPLGLSAALAVLGAAAVAGVALAGSSSDGTRALAAAPVNTAPPSIHGTLTEGATLEAHPGEWTADAPPLTFAYQWFRCDAPGGTCAPIAGATSQTYELTADDVGQTMVVQVTAVDAESTSSPAVNSADAAEPVREAADPVAAPVSASTPLVSGTTVQGSTLVAYPGQWTGHPAPTFAFVWQRCAPDGGSCTPIPGAVSRSYSLTAVDVATRLRVQVVAVNTEGAVSAESAVTSIVTIPLAPENVAPPTISGTARQGETLSSTTGHWTGAEPLELTRQWERCNAQGESCQAIPGATGGSYVVQAGDVDARIRLLVTATNEHGSASAASQPTAVVEATIPPGEAIPVDQVSLPNRLVVSRVAFQPSVLRSRAPFTARFRVNDSEGRPVAGADVFLVGVPFGRFEPAPIVKTDSTGWATFTLRPTAKMPLRKGFLITIFVRATKPGDDLLGGVSTRRLVSVRINPN